MTLRTCNYIRGAVFMAAIAPAPAVAQDALSCELKLESDGFQICYDDRYPEDAEEAKQILDKATERLRLRYGVQGTFNTLYLLGEPGTVECSGREFTINVGTALSCGGEEIYLLTKSSPERDTCCTQLGLHFQSDEYNVTVLVHEYSTAFQHGFPGFYSKPRWFYDGLEQYEGYVAADSPRLWRLAAEKTYNDNAISCGEGLMGEALSIAEPYAAGATYFRYLADRFGEQLHIDMIRDGRSDASQILAELIDESPCETFGHFRTWMSEQFGLGTPVPALPFIERALKRLFR